MMDFTDKFESDDIAELRYNPPDSHDGFSFQTRIAVVYAEKLHLYNPFFDYQQSGFVLNFSGELYTVGLEHDTELYAEPIEVSKG